MAAIFGQRLGRLARIIRPLRPAGLSGWPAADHRQTDDDAGAGAVQAGLGGDAAAVGFHDAPADRQAQPGPGGAAVAFLDPVEHVEHPLAVLRAECPGPWSQTSMTAWPSRSAVQTVTGVPGGEYLQALSIRLKITCSISIASRPEQRHGGIDLDPDRAAAQQLGRALDRRADDVAEIDPVGARLELAGAEPGHVQQVLDEAVQALGLVLDGLGQVEAVGGVQRSLVARSGWMPRPGSRPAASAGRATGWTAGPSAGARFRSPAGRSRCRRRGWSARSPRRPDRPACRAAGCPRARAGGRLPSIWTPSTPTGPRPVCSGRNSQSEVGSVVGAAAGGFGVRPCPFGRRPRLVVQPVFRRIAGPDGKLPAIGPAGIGQQHQRPAVDGRGDVVDDRPQHVVLVGRRRDLAAEAVQVGGAPGAQSRRLDLGADAGGEVAGDDGGQQEEHHRQDVLETRCRSVNSGSVKKKL